MTRFFDLQHTETNAHHKNIFEILARHENSSAIVNDAPAEITLDTGELEAIRNELAEAVQDARGTVQSATEMKKRLFTDLPAKIKEAITAAQAEKALQKNSGIVQDGYQNTVSGIGTIIDPGMNTESFVPVSILPQEATAYYANGGLPARIINKKAGCLSLNGVHFDCAEFSSDDLTRLDDYAAACGFSEAYSESITQALIFGGAVCYPVFDCDNPLTFIDDIKHVLTTLKSNKDFIKYWVMADRWNCVFVPEYNITVQDYLFARSLFIPLGGVRVSTSRMAIVRPQKLPFWGAIQQMGWATSDFEGWIRDFEAYQIMKMSLPIMAQQSSLMYHAIPADGLIIENGPEFARQYFAENEKQMRDWSILHPRTVNSVGEIKILERTYTGWDNLFRASERALCASCGVPESILFAEKSTGLASDNEEDVTLKQSEMIRLLFNNVAPAFKNCIKLLVYSCFGLDSEQAKHADKVQIKADTGNIISDTDNAQMGQGFAAIIAQLCAAGVPLAAAVKTARGFVPKAEIDAETLDAMGAGDNDGIDESLWNMVNAGREMQ